MVADEVRNLAMRASDAAKNTASLIEGSVKKIKNGSDIDLTLHGKDLTLKLLHKIENQLDELLLPYKIDLSIFNQISNPDLIEHILRVGITFFEPESHSTAAKKDWVVKDIEED